MAKYAAPLHQRSFDIAVTQQFVSQLVLGARISHQRAHHFGCASAVLHRHTHGEVTRIIGPVVNSLTQNAEPAAYRRVLAIDPGHADAYLNLGALLCESRRFDEAVALYDEALKRKPHEALLHFNRAIALEDRGDAAAALASYHACLRLSPDLADAHYNAARLHQQLGDARQAVRHFNAYRRLQRPH